MIGHVAECAYCISEGLRWIPLIVFKSKYANTIYNWCTLNQHPKIVCARTSWYYIYCISLPAGPNGAEPALDHMELKIDNKGGGDCRWGYLPLHWVLYQSKHVSHFSIFWFTMWCGLAPSTPWFFGCLKSFVVSPRIDQRILESRSCGVRHTLVESVRRK